jgi:hypothetical protein
MFGLDLEVLQNLVDKARALIGVRKLGAAERLLIDLDDLVPGSAPIACLLADVRSRLGDYEGALKALSRALAGSSHDPFATQVALVGRAQVWMQMGERALAQADLDGAGYGPDPRLVEFAHRALSSSSREVES